MCGWSLYLKKCSQCPCWGCVSVFSVLELTLASFRTLDTFSFSSSKSPFLPPPHPNGMTDCGELTIQLRHVSVIGCLPTLLSLFAVEGRVALPAGHPARHHADGFTSVAQSAASWSRHRRASPRPPLTLSTLLKMAGERLIAGHRGARVHSCLRAGEKQRLRI